MGPTDNKLIEAIKAGAGDQTVNVDGGQAALDFSSATVAETGVTASGTDGEINITVGNVGGLPNGQRIQSGAGKAETTKVEKAVKEQLEGLVGKGKIAKVTLDGTGGAPTFNLTVKVTLAIGGKWTIEELKAAAGGSNQLQAKIREAQGVQVNGQLVTMTDATVTAGDVTPKEDADTIQIVVRNVPNAGNGGVNTGQLQTKLGEAVGTGKIQSVTGNGASNDTLTLEVELTDDVKNTGREWLVDELRALASTKEATSADNRLANALRAVGVVSKPGSTETVNFSRAQVEPTTGVKRGKVDNTIEIAVGGVQGADKADENAIKDHAQTQLALLIGAGRIAKVTLSGQVAGSGTAFDLTIKVNAIDVGVLEEGLSLDSDKKR